jgi:hypothetical protein
LDIGYDDRNSFIALGTLSLVVQYYFLRFGISLVVKLVLKVFGLK